jgi:hypothetical protein
MCICSRIQFEFSSNNPFIIKALTKRGASLLLLASDGESDLPRRFYLKELILVVGYDDWIHRRNPPPPLAPDNLRYKLDCKTLNEDEIL